MRSECARVRQPEPEFSNESRFFVVYLRYNRPLTTIVSEQVTNQVTDQLQRFLRVFSDKQLSMKEIAASMNLKSRGNIRQKYLKRALSENYIALC